MATLGPYELNSIVTGDARELAKAIPDKSVDLIFTDPVYDRIEDYEWLAETAARVLKDRGSVLAFCGHSYEIKAGAAMLISDLRAGPTLHHYITGTVSRLFSHSLQCNLIPCLWFSKGLPSNRWMFIQQLSIPKGERRHKWGKAELMVKTRLEVFTCPNALILDPFAGGGTVPAVCKQLNRQYLAFEIDPPTADLARQRVANTQPPLPLVYPEQMAMEVG
jgi:DNA modification methylase